MIADIFITTKDRPELLRKTLASLQHCTSNQDYRLTIVQDGMSIDPVVPDTRRVIEMYESLLPIEHIIEHRQVLGLGPSINQALAHIDTLKRWDGQSAPPLTVYIQDDVLFTPGWLQKLSQKFLQLEPLFKLGFASGVECVEHPIRKNVGNGLILKDWIRATCMMARHEYWMSMWPISRIDPETGRERGKPNDGMGSSVDWWFLRNHPNSVCRTGRTNLVIPGLLQHAGYDKSTWLKRELPESDNDKKIIREST